MRTLKIDDMYRQRHEIDVAFVEDIVQALDDSCLLDDVIRVIPVARIRTALVSSYETSIRKNNV